VRPPRTACNNTLRDDPLPSLPGLAGTSVVGTPSTHFEKVITRFDRPTTFFYLDPPYYRCEDDYGKGIFKREDFGKLRDILVGIKGKFILSLNDTPKVRELFKAFRTVSVKTSYSATTKGSRGGVSEVLIMNFISGKLPKVSK
jgi:site-specific DNA-adenine methylase